LEGILKSQRKNLVLPSNNKFVRAEVFKNNPTAKVMLFQKKIVLNRLIEKFNLFFLSLLSNLFNQFFFKINLSGDRITNVSTGIKFLDSFNIINPQFVARFIARRVSYGFQLQRVLKPLIRDLSLAMSKRKNKIVGFRIACSGRFDRKQIASYI